MQVLRYNEVSQRVHYCPAHIRRLIKKGEFPQPIKLGQNRVVFAEAEIKAWLEERANDRAVDVPS